MPQRKDVGIVFGGWLLAFPPREILALPTRLSSLQLLCFLHDLLLNVKL